MSSLRKKLRQFKRSIKKTKKLLGKNIVFSIGENCLSDNILSRHGLKSFSSPYSSARSNAEYLLSFEKERFADFVNSDYLFYDNESLNNVARNTKYVKTCNSYHNSCSKGFEFTHHDVIGEKDALKKIKRRYKRLLLLRNKNIVMLYHHRLCSETDMDLLTKHLDELSRIYKVRNNDVHIFLFTQNLVSDKSSRRVEHYLLNGIDCYNFYTINAWAGDNEEFLWAKCDEDLLKSMIIDIRKVLK